MTVRVREPGGFPAPLACLSESCDEERGGRTVGEGYHSIEADRP